MHLVGCGEVAPKNISQNRDVIENVLKNRGVRDSYRPKIDYCSIFGHRLFAQSLRQFPRLESQYFLYFLEAAVRDSIRWAEAREGTNEVA